MECINYKISESWKHQWNIYGANAIGIDYWNNKMQGGVSVNIVYDTVTGTVCEMEAWDYDREKEYRWIHPAYIEGLAAEAAERNVDFKQSIDDRKFIDLEVAEDILEKARAMVRGEEYDERIIVPLDLDDDQLFLLMKLAHEEDITMNQYVEKLLRKEIERLGG